MCVLSHDMFTRLMDFICANAETFAQSKLLITLSGIHKERPYRSHAPCSEGMTGCPIQRLGCSIRASRSSRGHQRIQEVYPQTRFLSSLAQKKVYVFAYQMVFEDLKSRNSGREHSLTHLLGRGSEPFKGTPNQFCCPCPFFGVAQSHASCMLETNRFFVGPAKDDIGCVGKPP